MKLKLIASGFENYTGQLGVINFVDGVSDADVSHKDAVRVAGAIGAEWEDGTSPNISQVYLEHMHTPAPMPAEFSARAIPVEVMTDETKVQSAAPVTTYTEQQLAAIADAEGIAGLRAIADPMGVKGNSIAGLITAILKLATTPVAPVEAPVGEVGAAPVGEVL